MNYSNKWEIEIIPAPKPTFVQQLRKQNEEVDKWLKEVSSKFNEPNNRKT